MNVIEYKQVEGTSRNGKSIFYASTDGKIYEVVDGTFYEKSFVISETGYAYVCLWKIEEYNDARLVHRIIASTFLGKKAIKNKEIRHIDGNKLNNNINNLEICKKSYAIVRAWKDGKFENVSGAIKRKRRSMKGKRTILTPNDVRQIRNLKNAGWTNKKIAALYDLSEMQICRICNFRSFKHIV